MRYRVDVVSDQGTTTQAIEIEAGTPQEAAELVIGEPLMRGAKNHAKVLRAKVLWKNGGVTMARFYGDPVTGGGRALPNSGAGAEGLKGLQVGPER